MTYGVISQPQLVGCMDSGGQNSPANSVQGPTMATHVSTTTHCHTGWQGVAEGGKGP